LGQGIGPLSDLVVEKKMCRTLPNVDLISLREQRKGLPILLQKGVKRSKIIVTGDDAIELAYQMQKSTLGDRLGLNLRMAFYADVDNNIKDSVIGLLGRFAEKHATRIVPIPISFHNQGEDLRAIEEITDCNPPVDQKGFEFETPQKIISWISQCRLVVTGSYHAGVFALSQGIPVIGLAKSIYYKDKFLGLADQFGEGCQALLLDQPDWKEILSLVLENFWCQAPALKPKLLASAKRQIESGQAAYQCLRELVGR
jgi:colanic acid/amylovoran biosynthesis protein